MEFELVLRVLAVLVLFGVCPLAFFPVLDVFFRSRVERITQILQEAPARSFWVGVANFAFFAILILALVGIGKAVGNEGVVGLAVVILSIPLILGLIFGLAGAVKITGSRLLPEAGRIKQTILGTAALGGACALPFVGWFGLLPYVGLLGLGAVMLSFFARPRPAALEPAAETPQA